MGLFFFSSQTFYYYFLLILFVVLRRSANHKRFLFYTGHYQIPIPPFWLKHSPPKSLITVDMNNLKHGKNGLHFSKPLKSRNNATTPPPPSAQPVITWHHIPPPSLETFLKLAKIADAQARNPIERQIQEDVQMILRLYVRSLLLPPDKR